MKFILGVIMVLLLVIAVIVFACSMIGWKLAILVFGGVALLIVYLSLMIFFLSR